MNRGLAMMVRAQLRLTHEMACADRVLGHGPITRIAFVVLTAWTVR